MDEKANINTHLTGLIIKDFNLEEDPFGLLSDGTGEIKKRLREIIDYLLEKDFERLLNAMYRLDINEDRFREVIEGKAGNDVSGVLADMILERELRKVQTRIRYSKRNTNDH